MAHTLGVALVNVTGSADDAVAVMATVPAVSEVSAGCANVIVCCVSLNTCGTDVDDLTVGSAVSDDAGRPAAAAGSAPAPTPETAASAAAPTSAHLIPPRDRPDPVILIINRVSRIRAPLLAGGRRNGQLRLKIFRFGPKAQSSPGTCASRTHRPYPYQPKSPTASP
jgi:hypothetical protein